MKPTVLAGVLLVVLGVAALAYQGFTYTDQKTVVDLGPLEAQVETEETVPIPPIVGAAAVAGGLALVVGGSKGKS